MNQPSHYQTVFFRELASRQGISLAVFYATDVSPDRKALGWVEPTTEAYSQEMLSDWRESLIVAWRLRSAIHVVNGVWSVPIFVLCSLFLVTMGAPIYFHSERPNPESSREGIWRLLKRAWVKLVVNRAQGIFAIGRRAGDYYRDLGVPAEKIIPFMYFNRGAGALPAGRNQGRPFTVIYAGQFVARKRVEDLIEAFAQLRAEKLNAWLKLVGSGPLRKAYLSSFRQLHLNACFEISGPLAPAGVIAAIQRSDVLVLPSAFDGWGLTVNEALQAGVPVICSDACGAAELLIDNPHWGIVYPAGDVGRLGAALCEIALNPRKFCPLPAEVEAEIGPAALTERFLHVVMDIRPQMQKL